jgi:hypothetical protein
MDDTVGSLTEFQKSIIVGKLLGDGSLRKKANTLLEINHSHKQKDYVFWQYEQFSNLVLTPPKLRNSGFNRQSYRFTTKSIESLNSFYSDFYDEKKIKRIPSNLKLNSISIAVWFMDDGSKDRDSVYLNTQQFCVSDQMKLLNSLLSLDLIGSLNKDKNYYRIRLYKNSLQKFKDLVEPYLIPSMKYKLP